MIPSHIPAFFPSLAKLPVLSDYIQLEIIKAQFLNRIFLSSKNGTSCLVLEHIIV